MNAQHQQRLAQIRAERLKRARELVAYMDTTGIEIGWEGEHTSFCPASACSQQLIEEATILSAEIRALKEGRAK